MLGVLFVSASATVQLGEIFSDKYCIVWAKRIGRHIHIRYAPYRWFLFDSRSAGICISPNL
jgi:hypothetical protein